MKQPKESSYAIIINYLFRTKHESGESPKAISYIRGKMEIRIKKMFIVCVIGLCFVYRNNIVYFSLYIFCFVCNISLSLGCFHLFRCLDYASSFHNTASVVGLLSISFIFDAFSQLQSQHCQHMK